WEPLRTRSRHHRRQLERTPLLRSRPWPAGSGRAEQTKQAERDIRRRGAIMTSPLRCAIYTRVSSDAGLEQHFNSLDAQRESAEAYIKSQAHEGWRLVSERFDDGGYSGGSTDRPALQRLLDRIRERRVDVAVVYKVDRLIPKALLADSLGDSRIEAMLIQDGMEGWRHAISGQIARGLFGEGASGVGPEVEGRQPEPAASVAGCGQGWNGSGIGGEDRRQADLARLGPS